MFLKSIIWKLLVTFQVVYGSGIVEIRLLKFINSGGVGSNGHCCDGRGPFCFSDCDHMFKICVDNADGPDNMQTCPFFRRDSGEITNTNIVTFGTTIAGIPNPFKINFESWPGELKLKVEAWDVDDNTPDHVDFLSGVFGLKASRNEHEAAVAAFQIRSRTLLTYNVKVYCDQHFYGEHCDTFCNPKDPEGHYDCDTTTGMRVCDEGWSGEYCEENNINECLTSPCNASMTCVDTPRGYDCVCPGGLEGPNCDIPVNNTCTPDICLNGGTCSSYEGRVTCTCPEGYFGLACEISSPFCASMPCQNGANCTVTSLSVHAVSVECLCPPGFTGVFCETEISTEHHLTSPIDLKNYSQVITTPEMLKTTEIQNLTESTTKPPDVVHETTITLSTTTVKPFLPTLTVRGRIDKNNQEAVGTGLRDMLYELIGIREQLYLDIKYKVKQTPEGDITSEIIIESAFDGNNPVNSSLIQHVFNDTPRGFMENHIHMPVVRQRPARAHSHEPGHAANSWVHNYWFIVVILVIGVVCLIIALGIIVRYKRKKNVDSSSSTSTSQRNNTAVSPPSSSSQSFENSLYFEVKRNNNEQTNNLDYKSVP